MNREIKCRAFVKNFGMQEIAGFQTIADKFVTLYYEKGFHAGIPFEQIELMQYTGLKDKNGKEIYESDIVKAEAFSPNLYQIVFLDGSFVAFTPFATVIEITCFYSSTGCELEVIGNIYENPELLEVQ